VIGAQAAQALAKPRLRGVSHWWAFWVAIIAGAALVISAPATAIAVYAISLAAMLGTSAAYHRGAWSPRALRVIRRLDHSMIFVLVAGTYTPFATFVLDDALGTAVLLVVWTGAFAGIAMNLIWTDAPRSATAVSYVALGWVIVFASPQVIDQAGLTCVALLLLGGLLYTAGAVVYARQWPDPAPAVFGFHEVFHLLVVAAAATHFAAVAVYATP
jgi:hemolysin III